MLFFYGILFKQLLRHADSLSMLTWVNRTMFCNAEVQYLNLSQFKQILGETERIFPLNKYSRCSVAKWFRALML